MVQSSHLFSLKADSESVLAFLTTAFNDAGVQVMRSFDLQAARSAHTQCTCPHHGSDQCSCQMIVLLVYDNELSPVTLVVHGKDDVTHLGLISGSPRVDTQWLEAFLGRALHGYCLDCRPHFTSDLTEIRGSI
jgi:hypothetical protein